MFDETNLDKTDIFPKQETSPTIQNILDGKAKITYLGDGLEEKVIEEEKYACTYYKYKLEVPSPKADGGIWETTITTWHPQHYAQKPYKKFPDVQITIESGGKDILLSNNRATINKVYDEIYRQTAEVNQPQE